MIPIRAEIELCHLIEHRKSEAIRFISSISEDKDQLKTLRELNGIIKSAKKLN